MDNTLNFASRHNSMNIPVIEIMIFKDEVEETGDDSNTFILVYDYLVTFTLTTEVIIRTYYLRGHSNFAVYHVI